MAAPSPAHNGPVGPDTLITVKIIIGGNNRRFKLALRDLGAQVLPQKLRFLLAIPPEDEVTFERFSDSAGSYITLDSSNPAIYKQLYRAAKAKLKLRLKATISSESVKAMSGPEKTTTLEQDPIAAESTAQAGARHSYLETVLSSPPQSLDANLTSMGALPECYQPRSGKTSSLEAEFHKQLVGMMNAGKLKFDSEQNEKYENLDPEQKENLDKPAGEPLSRATLPSFHDFHSGPFCIDCNNCGKSIPNEHYHCSICDDGDFDLCQSCVDQDIACDGEGHWLIKRSIRSGMVISSVTETIAPKKSKVTDTILEDEGALRRAIPDVLHGNASWAERTCNSCISEFPGNNFVTCLNCPDFDLCFACFSIGDHGHHPAHKFQPVSEDHQVTPRVRSLCFAGRGLQHAAICDGCDKDIFGVRHKCLTCPDWDFCSSCVLSASDIHPDHRFAPLYEPIADVTTRPVTHDGIYCDGPLCAAKSRKSYIKGDRYKCAVCHDTDFCANCEAIPTHSHNRTHPLIKFKTPVRHVSVTTLGENNDGAAVTRTGDAFHAKNASTETLPNARSANAATQVQTVAEVQPLEPVTPEAPKPEPVSSSKILPTDLRAFFESDSTPDGSRFPANCLVSQSWTLRNPGPQAWPAGCAVYYIGGDDMRSLDLAHPSSVSAMTSATRSNVLEHAVEPGETAVFEVLLKSPAHEGRVISYWRLKTPEGIPFGHKLWVDITVTSTAISAAEEATSTGTTTPWKDAPRPMVEEETETASSSTMIFPKLDKESPVSSMHDVSEALVAERLTKAEEQELIEDVESLELGEGSTDDGFLTDEEYDILDASDEDMLMEAQKAAKK